MRCTICADERVGHKREKASVFVSQMPHGLFIAKLVKATRKGSLRPYRMGDNNGNNYIRTAHQLALNHNAKDESVETRPSFTH